MVVFTKKKALTSAFGSRWHRSTAFLCKTNKLSHAYFFLIFRSHAMTDVGHIRYCTSHKTGVIWRTVGATIFYEIEASVHNIAFGQVTAYLVHRTYGKN